MPQSKEQRSGAFDPDLSHFLPKPHRLSWLVDEDDDGGNSNNNSRSGSS